MFVNVQKGKGGAFAQFGTNAYAQQGGGGGGAMGGMGGGAMGANGLNDVQNQVCMYVCIHN